MMKKIAGVITFVVLAVAIIVGFVLISHRTPKTVEDTAEITEADELINKDISSQYPATPREVMKLYNRYILCLYGIDGEDLTEEQVHELGAKMREIYDAELLEGNPEDGYYQKLTQELAAYRNAKKVMIQANVCDSNEVENIDINGTEGALVEASYFTKEDSQNFTRTYEQFLMRKDADGRWKILGFEKIQGGES